VNERTEAIVELLSGKATVDQVALRFGVHPKTVEKWREVALEGIEQSMRQGSGRSKREVDLERKLRMLERAFTDLAIRHELVERALSQRPTRPGKSSR
jgi:transposase-like protein